jgi:anti-sigma B factor antagonist
MDENKDKPEVVQVSGEIDLANTDKLDSALNDAIRKSEHGIIVDMSGVTYIDSAGIQSLLAAHSRVVAKGGKLILVIKHPNIKAILDIVHLDRLPGFIVCDDLSLVE